MGLAGTRLVYRRGRFSYIHRDGQPLGGRRHRRGGSQAHRRPVQQPRRRVRHDGLLVRACSWPTSKRASWPKTRSQRTLDDYTGYAADDGPLVAAFGKIFPEQITPHMVQAYLAYNAQLSPPRPVPANRERAFLSSCLSWLLREGKVPGLTVNPCMRASGVQRNPETQRDRYVTDEEYRAVYAAGESIGAPGHGAGLSHPAAARGRRAGLDPGERPGEGRRAACCTSASPRRAG